MSFPAGIPEYLPEPDRPLPRLGGLRPTIDQGELVGVLVEELGDRPVVVGWEPQGTFVLGSGLAVGTERCRLPRGGRREAWDQGRIAGTLRVVRQSCVVVVARTGEEGVEQGTVSGRSSVRGYGGLNGAPRQLVPEVQVLAVGGEEPGRHQLVENVDADAGRRSHQRGFDPVAVQGGDLEHLAGGLLESRRPGQHRVARRGRDLVAVGAEHLDQEERVAAGQPVQLLRAVRRALGQTAYARSGERWQVDAPGPALAGQLAERHPKGVGRGERVVAEG